MSLVMNLLTAGHRHHDTQESPKKAPPAHTQSHFIASNYDLLVSLLLVLFMGSYFFGKLSPGQSIKHITFGDFVLQIEQGSVEEFEIQGRQVRGRIAGTSEQFDFKTTLPDYIDTRLIK